MADDSERSDDDRDDPDRAAILRRRNRLVAVALSGVAAASLGACEPCLSIVARDSGADASPTSDAGRPRSDAGAHDAGRPDAGPRDAGSDARIAEDDAGDGPSDAGSDAAAPLPCLTPKP